MFENEFYAVLIQVNAEKRPVLLAIERDDDDLITTKCVGKTHLMIIVADFRPHFVLRQLVV